MENSSPRLFLILLKLTRCEELASEIMFIQLRRVAVVLMPYRRMDNVGVDKVNDS